MGRRLSGRNRGVSSPTQQARRSRDRALRQPLKGRVFHGPEQPVGVPVGRSSLQGCGDHSSGEGEPEASQLGVVVVPASAVILLGVHEFRDALALGFVSGLVLFLREVSGIPECGEHDEGADCVAGRQTVQLVFSTAPWSFRPERVDLRRARPDVIPVQQVEDGRDVGDRRGDESPADQMNELALMPNAARRVPELQVPRKDGFFPCRSARGDGLRRRPRRKCSYTR